MKNKNNCEVVYKAKKRSTKLILGILRVLLDLGSWVTGLYWRPKRQSSIKNKTSEKRRRSPRGRRLIGQKTVKGGERTAREEWADKKSTADEEERRQQR